MEDFSANGFRDLGFEDDGSVEGISCGDQRMPGRRPKRDFLGFMVELEGEDEGEMGSTGAKRGGMI